MKIVGRNDPVLWQAESSVVDIAAEVLPHLDAMRELMFVGPVKAAGLSAPQVGIPLRFFITKYPDAKVVINPTITSASEQMVSAPEGCMSWNGGSSRTWVRRHVWVNLAWTDVEGVQRTGKFTGFEARVMQHENDHLNGVNIFSR